MTIGFEKYYLKVSTALIASIGLFASSLGAVSFTVNSTVDSVDANPGDGICETTLPSECTLRAAIQETNALSGADTIVLMNGTYILSIAGRRENMAFTGDLDIHDDLSIIGVDITSSIIDAGKVDRVFDVVDSADVTIDGMTIQNGDLDNVGAFGEHGGGIRNQGTLALNEVIVSGNTAGVNFGIGGGIYNVGQLILTYVSVSDNSALRAGGIANLHDGDITLKNVTIKNNTAPQTVAGMWNGENIIGRSSTATLTNVTISGNIGGTFSTSHGGFKNGGFRDIATLRNVTISGNSGWASGGIAAVNSTLMNSIISNNIAVNPIAGDCEPGGVISLGYNIDSDGTCALTEPTDLPNTDPVLGILADNGGPTKTHALLEGSPAIDAGGENCTDAKGQPLLIDQRGDRRPVDGNRDGTVACDIGAYEVQPAVNFNDIDNNLIYVAVEPCRLADTRKTDIMQRGIARHFHVYGADLSGQGGGSCIHPKQGTKIEPLAASVYLVAVPTGSSSGGWLTAFPSDQTPPSSNSVATVNYANGQVVGNTTIATLCQPDGCPTDGQLGLVSFNSEQNVVIDVQGYFYPHSGGGGQVVAGLWQGTGREYMQMEPQQKLL
jgi:CSLREA domain-containing protein